MINLDAIPQAMKNEPRWLLWRTEKRNGKPTKVPYQVGGKKADSTDAATWCEFDEAAAAVEKFDGVGFVLGDGWTGVDLDGHVDSFGNLSDFAKSITTMFAETYIEFSPSKAGIHIIAIGEKPSNDHSKDNKRGIEIYDRARFFTVTGDTLNNKGVRKCQEAIEQLYYWLWPPVKAKPEQEKPSASPSAEDAAILEKAKSAKNGHKFWQLYEGDASDYVSQSEADMAFCQMLAFWTQDAAQIERIWCESALSREKLDREDYRARTIEKALNWTTETYQPGKPKERTPTTEYVRDEQPVDDAELDQEAKTDTDIPFDVDAVVPYRSWLSEYLNFVRPTTDANDQFTVAVGMTTLSMACRDMFFQFGQQKLHPNIWLALVAPSTMYRKTASISIGQTMVESYDSGTTFPNQMSPEAFVKCLAKDKAWGMFVWSEMSSQLHAFEHRSYMRGYISDLTDIYDCPPTWNRRTNSDGLLEVKQPFVNILTGTTQEWLNECLTEGNLKGGFLPRFLYVFSFSKDKFYPLPQPFDPTARRLLVEWLSEISQRFRGGMTLSPSAKELFEKYSYQLNDEASANKDWEGVLGAFYSRLQQYMVKFALIYQADTQSSKNAKSSERVVTGDSMQYAMNWTDYLKQGIALLLDKITFSSEMADVKKVEGLIRSEPGILRSTLYRRARLPKKRLDEAITHLIDAEVIAQRRESANTKPKLHYYLLKGNTDDSNV